MKKHILAMVAVGIFGASPTHADVLTGDTRFACEALLCLSSGTRPAACAASLSRYFSINRRRFSDTLRARFDFLNLCPVSNQTPEMRALVVAIRDGAGRCDAEYLNQTLLREGTRQVCPNSWRSDDDVCYTETYMMVDNTKPVYCDAYENHQYTSEIGARYVGTPDNGGYWASAQDYDRAVAEYNANLAAQTQQQTNYWWR